MNFFILVTDTQNSILEVPQIKSSVLNDIDTKEGLIIYLDDNDK